MQKAMVIILALATATESYAAIPLRQSCLLPPKHGLCEADITRFHYSQAAGTCRKFIYGGCDGNANNFRSLTECLVACSGTRG
ncbi:kunitz-type serine protease inhibitor 2-like [Ornithodoros turicata]|uniref:kunitz-type serine protease inhibitor 2-like n=1 Tax=Ornithodoros turicata TaxID=34597 RepID=UPI0031392E73